jgi:hypothetical protein
MVDFAKERVLVGSQPAQIPVVVINDFEKAWHGPVTLRLKLDGHLEAEMKQECRLEPWGKSTLKFEVKWPVQPGHCTLEAELTGAEGKPVRSLRDHRDRERELFRPGLSQDGHGLVRARGSLLSR